MKTVEIYMCQECPYMHILKQMNPDWFNAPYCCYEHPFRMIEDDEIYTIPDWCPLEDE